MSQTVLVVENIAHAPRDLPAERLAAHIENVVAGAPPLTPNQRDRLATLLCPTGGAA